MNIEHINEETIDVNGTSLVGYVRTTFAELVAKLGEPLDGCDKSTAEWYIEFADGSVATIYDWKLSATPTYEYDWHIGGHDRSVVDKLSDALGLPCFNDSMKSRIFC